jgi:hypothetical protein
MVFYMVNCKNCAVLRHYPDTSMLSSVGGSWSLSRNVTMIVPENEAESCNS